MGLFVAQMPSQMFTEDFQVDFLREHHHVFDDLRKTYLSGEMVWNFADFMTGQSKTHHVFPVVVYSCGLVLWFRRVCT